MEKVRRYSGPIAAILILVALMAIFLVALNYIQNSPITLYPGEVQNYEGQNLASIGEVRENAIKGTQYLNNSDYRLAINGLVDENLSLTYDEVVNGLQSYQKVVNLYCVEGWNATILWEGVLVDDLLNQAGVNSNAVAVIFYASDGYSTSLPLDYIRNNHILLAYKMNGLTIPPERGYPFELVAESQYGYKWIKWVTQIEVTDNPDYRGYWESRGYPNNATLR
ncbi:MAG: molybdopterin-dependent oxidoreductase [Candidatus Bathyarchaeia archaeon]|jgi:DMSO/TMAO reductase YedYZ molybdopterin-dependent catalytic subunit